MLYAIYLALTVAEFLALVIARMPVFDALNTAVATAGTGGFGVKATSMGGYSPAIQWVVAVFMMLFGVNFGVYFLLLTKRFRAAALHEEVRYYLLIIVGAVAVIVASLYAFGVSPEMSFMTKLRHAFFQVASVITTTGFTTMVTLMFVGACAGSTGGGIKVSRVLIFFRTVKRELMLFFHPKRVVPIKAEQKAVPPEVVRSVSVFLSAYVLVFAISVLLVSLDNNDFTTTFTAVTATMNNIGPGLSKAGPTESFSFFSPFAKYVMMFDMLAGRLELYPMLIMLMPDFWKGMIPRLKK